jgi:hypothetical protein
LTGEIALLIVRNAKGRDATRAYSLTAAYDLVIDAEKWGFKGRKWLPLVHPYMRFNKLDRCDL